MDRLFLKDVDAWTEEDLEALVITQEPEGMRIDYKRDLNLDKKSEKAEAAKDVSGLANAQGGWLFWGIDEDDSEEPLPTAIDPLPAEGLQTKLENVLDSTLEPRAEFHAATIPVEGGVVIVMRVEPRKGNPLMVQGYGEYRYYRRSGTRTVPMSATEVAEAHASAKARDEALKLRIDRLPLFSRIDAMPRLETPGILGTNLPTPPWLEPAVAVVIAAIDSPDPLIGTRQLSDLEFEEVREGQRGDVRRRVLPDARWTMTAEGVERRQGGDDIDEAVAHLLSIYRTGVIEWVRRYSTPGLPSSTFAQDVHDVLLYGARVFDEVGYSGRLAIWVRVENADREVLILPEPWNQERSSIKPRQDALSAYLEVSSDELLIDPTPTVREAMDLIWQGFGIDRCLLFDRDGGWTDD